MGGVTGRHSHHSHRSSHHLARSLILPRRRGGRWVQGTAWFYMARDGILLRLFLNGY